MSQFLDSISNVKKNYKKYDAWEQNQADDAAKRQYLSKKLELPEDKVQLTKLKAQSVFRASDIMDKRSEDNCANMERTTSLIGLAIILPIASAVMYYPLRLAKKGKTLSTKKALYFNVISLASVLIPSIGLSLWGNAKQKEASRIGRFQAKQHELKDAKNFVIYTSEQIKAAKTLAKNIPDKNPKKSFSKLFAEMKQMSQDKVEYKNWFKQKNSNDEEIKKILNTEFTPEQILQGEDDKEIIVNIVKDVNMSAETYSENVENAFDTIGMLTYITDIPIYLGVNKILKNLKNVSPAMKQFAPWLACALFPLPMTFWATHEKKQASRVGRFVKRQEIIDNPELIMSYSPQQVNLAKDIKSPKIEKSFSEKTFDNLKFFKKYLKESKAYKKYKETTAKENEKFYEALQQVEVSGHQLKEAKNLQVKTFRTFDKIDEMSQRYSEDTEAATEIAKQVITPIVSVVGYGIPFVITYSLQKGRFPLKGVLKTVSNMVFKKDSSIRTFVTKAFEIINNDKQLKKDFSKIFVDKNVQERVCTKPELKKLYTELFSENEKQLISKITQVKDKKEFDIIAKELFNKHFKQTAVSKWLRNLLVDIIKLRTNIKSRSKSVNNAIIKSGPNNNNPLNNIKKVYNDYKTLSKTLIFGGFVPVLGITVGIPFAISSWMTNVQLKAGRIGIMKAMEEVDNPKLFVNENPEKSK